MNDTAEEDKIAQIGSESTGNNASEEVKLNTEPSAAESENSTEVVETEKTENDTEEAETDKTENDTEAAEAVNTEDDTEKAEAVNAEDDTEKAEAVNIENDSKEAETEKTERESEPVETEEKSDAETEAAAAAVAAPEMTDFQTGSFVDEALFEAQKKKNERKSKVKKFFKVLGITVAATVVCCYIAVSVWFVFHFNDRTYINGNNCSFKSLKSVDNDIESYMDNYTLTLKLIDGEEYVIEPSQINLVMSPSSTAKGLHKAQNGFAWPYYISIDKNYEVTYTLEYDKDMLTDLLSECKFAKTEYMIRPKSAYVEIQNGKAVIISEKLGNYIDFNKLCDIIDEAITAGEVTIELAETEAYIKPELTSDSEEIIQKKDRLEKLLEMEITFEMDEMSWVLTSEDYGDWLIGRGKGWSVSETDVRKYVESVAEKYDTYGSEREFTTHDGRTITETGEEYGWQIDVDVETTKLVSLLKAGVSATHEPALISAGAAYTSDGDDIGDSYVECDLGQQHIYVYVDGRVVLDSDCVSGSVASGRATPEGLYTILFKKTPALLIGADYETPVKFWIPFIGSLGIGFHDATWRGTFGGEIYKSGGSHGCVNLPYSVAQQLYDIVYAGMPVICYY